MTPQYSDAEVVNLYREWSEACFSAGFMGADDYRGYVEDFRGWLKDADRPALLVYEKEMLTEFRRQEEQIWCNLRAMMQTCRHCGRTFYARTEYPIRCKGCQRPYPLGFPPDEVAKQFGIPVNTAPDGR